MLASRRFVFGALLFGDVRERDHGKFAPVGIFERLRALITTGSRAPVGLRQVKFKPVAACGLPDFDLARRESAASSGGEKISA